MNCKSEHLKLLTPSLLGRVGVGLLLLISTTVYGQRMTESLHKLQYAEMVINSLYVDSVDEVKLVEDGISTLTPPTLPRRR